MIRNNLHKLLDGLDPSPLVNDFRADPLFIFDDEVVDLLIKSPASTKSIEALAKAKLCHLPYPKMTLQFCGQGPAKDTTWFTSIREEDYVFKIRTAWMSPRGCSLLERPMELFITSDQIDIEEAASKAEAYAAAAALRMAVLMTHISGFDREEVEGPVKLNKARTKKGKALIKSYSYIRIGHVYNNKGERENYADSKQRRMPIHMRAGHVRNQAYGEGRSERKLIWVPPVLVNYRPESQDQPILEKRVKT